MSSALAPWQTSTLPTRSVRAATVGLTFARSGGPAPRSGSCRSPERGLLRVFPHRDRTIASRTASVARTRTGTAPSWLLLPPLTRIFITLWSNRSSNRHSRRPRRWSTPPNARKRVGQGAATDRYLHHPVTADDERVRVRPVDAHRVHSDAPSSRCVRSNRRAVAPNLVDTAPPRAPPPSLHRFRLRAQGGCMHRVSFVLYCILGLLLSVAACTSSSTTSTGGWAGRRGAPPAARPAPGGWAGRRGAPPAAPPAARPARGDGRVDGEQHQQHGQHRGIGRSTGSTTSSTSSGGGCQCRRIARDRTPTARSARAPAACAVS